MPGILTVTPDRCWPGKIDMLLLVTRLHAHWSDGQPDASCLDLASDIAEIMVSRISDETLQQWDLLRMSAMGDDAAAQCPAHVVVLRDELTCLMDGCGWLIARGDAGRLPLMVLLGAMEGALKLALLTGREDPTAQIMAAILPTAIWRRGGSPQEMVTGFLQWVSSSDIHSSIVESCLAGDGDSGDGSEDEGWVGDLHTAATTVSNSMLRRLGQSSVKAQLAESITSSLSMLLPISSPSQARRMLSSGLASLIAAFCPQAALDHWLRGGEGGGVSIGQLAWMDTSNVRAAFSVHLMFEALRSIMALGRAEISQELMDRSSSRIVSQVRQVLADLSMGVDPMPPSAPGADVSVLQSTMSLIALREIRLCMFVASSHHFDIGIVTNLALHLVTVLCSIDSAMFDPHAFDVFLESEHWLSHCASSLKPLTLELGLMRSCSPSGADLLISVSEKAIEGQFARFEGFKGHVSTVISKHFLIY